MILADLFLCDVHLKKILSLEIRRNKQPLISFFVRIEGLEPPRLTAQDPKSCAAANYATSASLSLFPEPVQFGIAALPEWLSITQYPTGAKLIIEEMKSE